MSRKLFKVVKPNYAIFFWVMVLLYSTLSGLCAQTQGTFTDKRDGTTYKTVTYIFGKKDGSTKITWLAENLRYMSPNSFCVNNQASSCLKYGRLYTWFDAKKVCPEGWRLPSDEDWKSLSDLYGGLDKAGKHLKTKGKIKGTNKSLFNGLLAGARDPNGMFFKVGTAGFFWSSTESKTNANEASDWSIASWTNAFRHWEGGKRIGNSCRCVREE